MILLGVSFVVVDVVAHRSGFLVAGMLCNTAGVCFLIASVVARRRLNAS
jgi:hypothetical protein